jgi:hypothetical protein
MCFVLIIMKERFLSKDLFEFSFFPTFSFLVILYVLHLD